MTGLNNYIRYITGPDTLKRTIGELPILWILQSGFYIYLEIVQGYSANKNIRDGVSRILGGWVIIKAPRRLRPNIKHPKLFQTSPRNVNLFLLFSPRPLTTIWHLPLCVSVLSFSFLVNWTFEKWRDNPIFPIRTVSAIRFGATNSMGHGLVLMLFRMHFF